MSLFNYNIHDKKVEVKILSRYKCTGTSCREKTSCDSFAIRETKILVAILSSRWYGYKLIIHWNMLKLAIIYNGSNLEIEKGMSGIGKPYFLIEKTSIVEIHFI